MKTAAMIMAVMNGTCCLSLIFGALPFTLIMLFFVGVLYLWAETALFLTNLA